MISNLSKNIQKTKTKNSKHYKPFDISKFQQALMAIRFLIATFPSYESSAQAQIERVN